MTLLLQTVYVQLTGLTGPSTDRPEHNCSRDNRQKYCTYQVQLDPNVEKTELQMGKRVGPRA